MEIGTFSSLENLERKRHEKLAKPVENASISKLKRKHETLKKKRDALVDTLSTKEKALEVLERDEDNCSDIGEDVHEYLLNLELQRVEEVLTAYRLTGTTVEVIDEKQSRLRFDTCYKGEFVKAFYTELNIKGGLYHIARHSLPEFIPQETLEQKLAEGLKEFCQFVYSFLRAFIVRRQEAFIVQERYSDYLQSEICSSPAFDYIELCMTNCEEVKAIQLLYNDLKSVKPTKVVLKLSKAVEDEDMKERLENFEKDLYILPLSEVFQTYFVEDEEGN